MAKLATGVILFVSVVSAFGNETSSSNDDQQPSDTTNTVIGMLVNRIDKLEERMAAMEQKHKMDMAAMENTHKVDMESMQRGYHAKVNHLHRQLDKKTKRTSMLEAVVRRQAKRIKDIAEFAGRDASSANRHDMGSAAPSTVESSGIVKTANRIKRADSDIDVAFFATLSASLHHLGTDQDVVFDNVITNVGNGYNSYIGAFVAPVAGIYAFSTSLTTFEFDKAHYSFYRNADKLTTFYLQGNVMFGDANSQTIVLTLNQGDVVAVKHQETDMHSLWGENHCTFSGFLLASHSSVAIVGK